MLGSRRLSGWSKLLLRLHFGGWLLRCLLREYGVCKDNGNVECDFKRKPHCVLFH